MTGFVEPVVLRRERWVSLEPLTPAHAPEIAAAAAAGDVGGLWFTSAPSPQTATEWVDLRLSVQHPDTGLTFVARATDGRVIGSSAVSAAVCESGDGTRRCGIARFTREGQR